MTTDLDVLKAIAADPIAGKLSHGHLQILSLLCGQEFNGRAPNAAVIDRLGVPANSLTRRLDRLVELGLIRRKYAGEAARDRRAITLEATALGRAVAGRVAAIIAGAEAAA